MRGPVGDAAGRRTAPNANADSSFSHELETSTTTATARRPDTAASRHNSDAVSTRSTPADALGLTASPGASAVIDGRTLFATSEGWSESAPLVAVAEALRGDEM